MEIEQQKQQEIHGSSHLNYYETQTIKAYSEGDSLIQRVQGLKLNYVKVALFLIGGPCTGFSLWIAYYWSISLRKLLLYNESKISEATHFFVQNWDDTFSVVPRILFSMKKNFKDGNTSEVIGFVNRYCKYYLDISQNKFRCVEIPEEMLMECGKNMQTGLSSENLAWLRSIFGVGSIEIEIPNFLILLGEEIIHPIFIFQIYSVALWLYQEYIYYAIVIFVLTIFSAFLSLYMVRSNLIKLRKLALNDIQFNVLRDSQVVTVNSELIVPGDIIIIENEMKLPCDCVLIQGNCLIDEASLTGESQPIFKSAIDDVSNLLQIYSQKEQVEIKKQTLFSGTKVVQTPQNTICKALILRTSFSTSRGQLIRFILFPKPHNFNFFRESLIFILLLFVLCIIGFFVLLNNFLEILEDISIFLKFLDLITISVPPLLVTALQVGIEYSLRALSSKKIVCIQPPKVVEGGVIDMVCFDKTGTLTEDGMFLKGILAMSQKNVLEANIYTVKDEQKIGEKLQFIPNLLACLSSCHSVIEHQGNLSGDQMEKELLRVTRSKLIRLGNGDYHAKTVSGKDLKILKRFDFSSDRQCMSVAVEIDSQLYLFTKGASEKIHTLCLKDSLPTDIQRISDGYSKSGYRVISFAYKKIVNSQAPREELEKELSFLGLAFFENPVKHDTLSTIQQLNEVELRSTMITGDNIHTAIDVAIQTQIISEKSNLGIVKYDEKTKTVTIELIESKNGFERIRINSETDHPIDPKIFNNNQNNSNQPEKENSLSVIVNIPFKTDTQTQIQEFVQQVQEKAQNNYIFAIQGNFFELFEGFVNEKTTQYIPIFQYSYIYARFKPSQKARLVEIYQTLLKKYVAMVGDGANDCGALKQANVGLSLSTSEASISAPFTSEDSSISSIVSLIIQCRAGLSTTFHSFKYMALYSQIQFSTVVILYYRLHMIADMQFLWQDLFMATTLTITMVWTKATEKLTKEKPISSLLEKSNLISVFGAVTIQFLGQLFVIVSLVRRDFYIYVDPEAYMAEAAASGEEDDYYDLPVETMETTSLFFFSNILMIGCSMIFAEGHPFKKEFWTNKLYVANCIILFIYMWVMAGEKDSRFPELELYGDVLTEDEEGNDIPVAQGEIPSSWLVGLVPWAVLCMLAISFVEIFIIRKIFRKKQ